MAEDMKLEPTNDFHKMIEENLSFSKTDKTQV